MDLRTSFSFSEVSISHGGMLWKENHDKSLEDCPMHSTFTCHELIDKLCRFNQNVTPTITYEIQLTQCNQTYQLFKPYYSTSVISEFHRGLRRVSSSVII